MSDAGAIIALVRAVSPRLTECELMQLERVPIDAARAARQHALYVQALEELGARIEWLPALPEHPDAVFVEDTAVVLPGVAVITHPGVASRQAEVESTGRALERHRPLRRITPPGCLDGGDVLRIDRTLYVGLSARTNRAGLEQLAAAIEPLGFTARGVPLAGCLHLKSAVTAIGSERVLLNPQWVDPQVFGGLEILTVEDSEPAAANVLSVAGTTLVSSRYPRTAQRLRDAGVKVRVLEVDELHKAEAGLTCMSLILQ
ncbi:MAG TPA: N(G),N(G)-dimethylarginine dimethylaminohydrolase [Steroidobacteraceae bacterium]|nr:N(G),N(G)-dimethylarginine dimethylaminohydrolase [Steroidobacteraceae bacterium]